MGADQRKGERISYPGGKGATRGVARLEAWGQFCRWERVVWKGLSGAGLRTGRRWGDLQGRGRPQGWERARVRWGRGTGRWEVVQGPGCPGGGARCRLVSAVSPAWRLLPTHLCEVGVGTARHRVKWVPARMTSGALTPATAPGPLHTSRAVASLPALGPPGSPGPSGILIFLNFSLGPLFRFPRGSPSFLSFPRESLSVP